MQLKNTSSNMVSTQGFSECLRSKVAFGVPDCKIGMQKVTRRLEYEISGQILHMQPKVARKK